MNKIEIILIGTAVFLTSCIVVLLIVNYNNIQSIKTMEKSIEYLESQQEKATWQTFSYLYPLLINKKLKDQTIAIGNNKVELFKGKPYWFVINGDYSSINWNRNQTRWEEEDYEAKHLALYYKNIVLVSSNYATNKPRRWRGVYVINGDLYYENGEKVKQ